MSDGAVSPAMLIGKLPSAGDFVSRGLSPAERRWWDEALTQGMAAAAERHGTEFDALFDRAPPWRFRLSGPCGTLSGALCPSADATGRRFPLMAAHREAGYARGCEEALFAAFAAGDGADALLVRLLALQPSEEPEPAGWWLDGGEAAGIALLSCDEPDKVLPAMLAAARVSA